MEWDRIDYYYLEGMGLTAVRASSSTIAIPPRLLHFELRRASSFASHHQPVSIHHHNHHPIARISLLLCCPKPFPFLTQQQQQQKPSSPNSLAFSFLSSSSSAPFRCDCFCRSSSSLSSPPVVSLMSSRLAPAYSSSCGLTRLESRSHRGPKWAGLGNVKASVEIRSNSVFGEWCWKVVGRGSSSRCMENERNGQRIECYSGSSLAAAGGGGDQPIPSSSVLPPTLPPVSKVKGFAISFCPRCGGATEEKIPVGEHEKRYVCTACGAVHYQNPKMVVGCLVEHEGKILLCRRNIEPAYGLWTLPAGYMEMGESAAEGAARETLEEACANVQVLGLFAHLDIPLIGQSHIYFRAQLKDPHFAPGPESIECALFKLNEIPFDSLAFSSIQVALKMVISGQVCTGSLTSKKYIEDTEAGKWRVHHAVIDKRLGAGPSDLKGFAVRDVLIS